MLSARFDKLVVITDHARRRMAERHMDERLLSDLIETGEIRCKDSTRLWIAKNTLNATTIWYAPLRYRRQI